MTTPPRKSQAAQITTILERLDRMDAVSRVATDQRDRAEEVLKTVSDQVNEVSAKVETCIQILTAVVGRGGGSNAVDVNVSHAVGAEPAQTATKPSLLKPAATVGGSGLFGWLAGGGWDQINAFFKKLGG